MYAKAYAHVCLHTWKTGATELLSIRLSMCIRLYKVRVLLTFGILNLKEQFGWSTSLLNTRSLCYKR